MATYDLIVAGSGPAGQRAAIHATKLGKRVAVIEKREVVGGVCINTGTIPSKTMREAVLHFSGYNYQAIYGMNYRVKEKITMADLSFRVQHVIKTEIDVTQAQLSRNNVEVLIGIGQLRRSHITSEWRTRAASKSYEADIIIIATGTKPAASPRSRSTAAPSSTAIRSCDMPEMPKTLIVVGGGVIGVEYTCMFATLGVRVILVEKRPRLLEFADPEMVEALSYHLRDSRVTMRLNEEVESVEEMPDGSVVANLESKKKISGDALLYAVGRQGNVDDLNLRRRRHRGRFARPHSSGCRFPHQIAAHLRRRRRHRLSQPGFGFDGAGPHRRRPRLRRRRRALQPRFYPYGIYTIPEISFIGKTEEQLTDEDVPYEVGVAYYREIARGQIRGDTTGRLKFIFHRETRSCSACISSAKAPASCCTSARR